MHRNSMKSFQSWLKYLQSEGSAGETFRKFSVIAASILVLFCASLLFTRFAHRDFLGEKTRLIHECKSNPENNPDECYKLLSSRSSKVVAQPSAFRDPELRKGFGLSSDGQ